MKFTAERKTFAAAAETASKAAAGRVALEVLMSLRIEALDGIVAVTGTDLTTGRRVEIEADIDTPGRTVVSTTLAKAVAASNGDTVTCELTEALAVSVGGSDFTFDVIDPAQYPDEPTVDGEAIPIEGWERIRSVATIASTDTNRPLIGGVCFRNGWAMATDSYRLARTKVPEYGPEIVVPARSILELRESPREIVTDGRTVKATLDDGAWWSRLVEGVFPNGESMIEPKHGIACKATVDTDQMLEAIGRARLVVTDDIPMRCDFGPGGIAVSVAKGGRKRFAEFVPAKIEGEVEGVHLSMLYLKSLLAPVESADIEIIDARKAVWITADWWEALMMPVRV